MVLVRLLFFLALVAIASALLLYFFKKDRRYLRFVVQVVKYSIVLLAGTLLFFAFERLVIAL